MVRIKTKVVSLLIFMFLCVFMAPTVLIADKGELQKRIKQKINAPSNIQFQQDDIGVQSAVYDLPEQEKSQSDLKDLLTERKAGKAERSRREDKEEVDRVIGIGQAQETLFSSYAIYKTDYQAEIEDDVVTVKGEVVFEVFKKGGVRIPLIRSDVGLIDVSINKGASYVTALGGKYYLIIDKPGRYNLEMEFLIKAMRERENGPGNFNFEVIPAPISQFEFAMPETGVEIFVEPAIKVELRKQPQKTIAWAIMPNTNTITVRWTKELPKETITPVKLEPKAYVDVATYAAVGDGFIRAQTNLNYSILQSEIPVLRIALPDDVSILEVQGKDLRDWKVAAKEGMQYLDVYLNFGVKGSYVLTLSYEKKIGEGSVVAQIPWIKAQGVEREKGFLGVAAATNVELAVNKIEQASAIDVKELPPSIWRNTANPILLAFKYLSAPFNIAIDVTRHEELSVLVAAIDSVDYLTLQTDEGKSLTKAVYQVRNNVKQFIHFILPQNATLWSAFVAGKPVKPAKDRNGNILIPLEKSQQSDQGITQFPVEIVYLDKISKTGLFGNLKLHLPQADIPISSLSWSVYLPQEYLYFNFGGDVKELKEDVPMLGPFIRSVQGRMSGRYAWRKEKEDAQRFAQIAPQAGGFYQELQSAQMKGVLPIKIDIPEQGKLYRFSKLLVTEKESPWLSVSFVKVFKQARGLFKFLLFIAAIFSIAFLIKKRIKK